MTPINMTYISSRFADPGLAVEYGVREFPTLVYFENEHLSVSHGDLNIE